MFSNKHNRMHRENYFRALRQEEREREAGRQRRSDPLYQGGRMQTPFGIQLDMQLPAMLPGRRVTQWGTVYYERRANRSDRSRNRQL